MENSITGNLFARARDTAYIPRGHLKNMPQIRAVVWRIEKVMRITAAIILISTLHISAAGLGQNVNFSGKEVPMTTVFNAIQEQTGYGVLMPNDVLSQLKPVTVDFRNATVDQVLRLCFSLQSAKFKYSITGKNIFVSDDESTSMSPAHTAPIVSELSGTVKADDGSPLSGATVQVLGTKFAGSTNVKGEFIIRGLPNGKFKLQVTFVGYEKVIREFSLMDNDVKLGVVMKKFTSSLDEVQIIAYGTTTERLNTGDVTTVSSDAIAKQPVDNPLLSLEGKVPGLFITQATGYAGTGVIALVQGQNSLVNGNSPFFVVDGTPYPQQLLPNGAAILGLSGVTQAETGNPLSFINPSDIESITVLKDADATAIYGSRAANGAIIITTRRGKPGPTRISFDMQDGFGRVAHELSVLNTTQYLQMRHEALNNDGITPSLANGDYDLLLWDTTRNVNWQKTLIGRTAQFTNLTGSVSGGTANTQYLVSATFHRQTSVLPINFPDQKGSVHANISSSSVDQRFHFDFTLSYLLDDNHLPSVDLTSVATSLAPDAPPVYTNTGTVNWDPYQGMSTFALNPIASLYQTYQNKTSNLLANSIMSYQVLPGLALRASFGYNNLLSNEVGVNPFSADPPESIPYSQRTAGYGTNDINSWIIEPQATYKLIKGKSKIDVLAGSTIEQDNKNGQQIEGYGYNSDQALQSMQNASSISLRSTTYSVYRYNAGFGRINYDWDGKYLVNVSGRRDGSSRFGSANEFHDFGAVGLAWIFSEEPGIKTHLPFLNFGKLRVSYGTTGNDQIGDYQYLNQYFPQNPQVPYQNSTTLAPNGLANPYLQWENTRKAEAGLDLSFFGDRLIAAGSYNFNRSSNQLLPYVLPITTGFSSINENLPATVQNTGVELVLKSVNIKSKDFSWSTSVNLTVPRNKLVAYPGLAAAGYSPTYQIGKPITIFKVYKFEGVNSATGLYQFADGHGGLTNTPDTNFEMSKNVIVNPAQSFYGGFENTFRYKGFELDLLFQFVKQVGQNDYYGNAFLGTANNNQPTYILNRWQKPGDVASHQKYSSDFGVLDQSFDVVQSTGAFTDASFIRLRNVSLSWRFAQSWLKKAHVRNCVLFVHGENVFTFTHYKGMDPEIRSSTVLPPLQVVTFGLQLEL